MPAMIESVVFNQRVGRAVTASHAVSIPASPIDSPGEKAIPSFAAERPIKVNMPEDCVVARHVFDPAICGTDKLKIRVAILVDWSDPIQSQILDARVGGDRSP